MSSVKRATQLHLKILDMQVESLEEMAEGNTSHWVYDESSQRRINFISALHGCIQMLWMLIDSDEFGETELDPIARRIGMLSGIFK